MSISCAILGILSWKSSSGYELKKIFEESSTMHWSGNNNQIYKALIQLQNDGFVTSEMKHQDGLPSKKIYTITDEGISRLKNWIISPVELPEFKKMFLVKLAWSNVLTNQELYRLLDKYENEIKIQLMINKEKKKRGVDFPNRTPREIILWEMISDNTISSYQNELEWVEKVRESLFENKIVEESMKMKYEIIEYGDQKYLEILSCETPLNSGQDALELIALCGEHGTDFIMIHELAISEDFFKLKNGIAGEILQKFANYRIKVSAIISDEKINTGKFKDMILEANRGRHFRVFQSKEDAEKWMLT